MSVALFPWQREKRFQARLRLSSSQLSQVSSCPENRAEAWNLSAVWRRCSQDRAPGRNKVRVKRRRLVNAEALPRSRAAGKPPFDLHEAPKRKLLGCIHRLKD